MPMSMNNKEHIETYKTPGGVFAIDTVEDKQIADRLRAGESHQKEAFDIFVSFLKEGDVVVDAGAHVGTFSIPLALQGYSVIAFEPSSAAFTLLEQNIALNGVSVDARNKGLGSQTSTASLRDGEDGNTGSRSLVDGAGTIEIARLDDQVPHADAIKIDVEGMELRVLQGAKKIIEASSPAVLFEVHLSQMRVYGSTPRALQSYFSSRGYNLFLLTYDKNHIQVGKLWSLALAVFCLAPGTIFFNRLSHAFDVLAVPKRRPMLLAHHGALYTHIYIAGGKIIDVMRRAFGGLHR